MERLIKYFIPEAYKVELRVNKTTEEIQGHVVISGEQVAPSLKLHARDLRISQVLINNQKVPFELDENNQLLFLKSSESQNGVKNSKNIVNSQKITIDIRYAFKLSHSMIGMYLSTYQYQGRKERIISTQFESHYARMMLPCIDEPEAKAIFDLKIIDTDIEDTILSNMPIESEKILTYNSVNLDLDPKKDTSALDLNTKVSRKVVTFKTTPKMSTYLLAICIGKLHKVTGKNKHDIAVSTYAPLNHPLESLEFSNQIAMEALDFYDQLFDFPYPLPKLDQIAIPDFDAGAMENWGLVTYRESCLLADRNTPKTTKEYIATVVTHELSHQWFGNLVTMKWWDNLWLNESFANMMQFYSVDHLRPDWRIWQDYFTEDCFYALRRDSLKNVQAVQQTVSDPAEIDSLFDGAIVYAKGSHLLFMLMRLLGESKFFKGLKDYFQKYQYQNTSGDDLWFCLQKYADFDIKKLMDAWILQPGFPMLTKKDQSNTLKQTKNSLIDAKPQEFLQQRFLSDGSTDQTSWPLPKVSDDMSGHYILYLSNEEFQQKISQFNQLSFEQKIRLLVDRELLMRTPLVKTSSLLDLLPKFSSETIESVWQITASIVCAIKVFCPPDSPQYSKFQHYVLSIVTQNLNRLGFERQKGESVDDLKLRPLILNFAIYAEDQEVLRRLSENYDQNIGPNMKFETVSPELLDSIVSAKFRYRKELLFDDLLARYQVETNPNYKSMLLDTITDARQEQNIIKLITLLEDQKTVRLQDHLTLFAQLLSNFWIKERVFDWFYSHWNYIKQVTSGKSIDDYIRVIGTRIYRRQEADRFFDFFKAEQDDPAIARALKIAENNINTTLSWLESDREDLVERLSM